jgi:hypothetical protein
VRREGDARSAPTHGVAGTGQVTETRRSTVSTLGTDTERWRKTDAKLRGRVLDRLFGRVGADGYVRQTPYNEALETARGVLTEALDRRRKR